MHSGVTLSPLVARLASIGILDGVGMGLRAMRVGRFNTSTGRDDFRLPDFQLQTFRTSLPHEVHPRRDGSVPLNVERKL
jgi:hypothetical protein